MNSSEDPSPDRIAFILARVNAGLAKEWSQISELAASLEKTLKDAHALADRHISGERRAQWDEAWRDLRASFDRIRAADAEAQRCFASSKPSADPLEPWCDVLEREDEFNDRLDEIRRIGGESVSVGDRTVWDDLCEKIAHRIATLEAHVLAVRFQLELREKYGRQKADTLTKEIAQRLPKDADVAEAKKYAAQYRQAAADFEREKETFGGVWGILKSLMLVQPKQPEQRVRDRDRQRLQRPAV